MTITLEACHARKIIEDGCARQGTTEIVNTDQGSQFTAIAFPDAVLARRCNLSMEGREAWRDNVFVERVWRSVKYEHVHLKPYDNVSAASADIADYFDWHNTARPHLSLDRVTLEQAYLDWLPKQTEAA